jgi:ParB-like chromosome segregation protein Spo0J
VTKPQRRSSANLLASISASLTQSEPAEALAEQGLKVEYIAAELVRPDPVQPRRVLPESLHYAFHAERLTPAQALREMIQNAQVTTRQNGRPFANVLDLLSDLDSDDETDPLKYTPEEQLLRELTTLALTLREDGQVNPLTVVEWTQGVTRLYRIETGERRYWAAWLQREFISGYEGDGTIPCIIIPSDKASVFRQARENTARSGLSAIAMARQAALLILAVHGIDKPTQPVDNEFYRQALELDLRGKREFTGEILAAMGGMSRARFAQYKALLQLSDEAIELADRYSLDEGVLRPILALQPVDHLEMVRQIVKFQLNAKQVREMCDSNTKETADDHAKPSKESAQLARYIKALSSASAHQILDVVLQQEQDMQVVKVRFQGLRKLIEEAEALLG